MLCGWVSFLLGVVAFLSLPWISICQSMLAAQILEFDCTGLKEGTVGRKAWLELQATSIVAEEKFFAEGPVQALKVSLRALQVLSVDPSIPSACPVAASRLFLKAMRFAVAAGQPSRARLLSQIANLFKLQAMSRSVTQCNKKDNEGLQQGKNKTSTASVSSSSSCPAVDGGGTHMGESLPPHSSSSCSTDGVERGNQGSKEANPECEGLQRIWDPHLQSQLSLALIHLGVRGGAGDPASAISWLNHLSMKQQQRQQGGGALQGGGERKKPRIEIHSICDFPPESLLPKLALINHKLYADLHGIPCFLHEKKLLPDLEAHFSKLLLVSRRLQGLSVDPAVIHRRERGGEEGERTEPADWVVWIDCDAFVTNMAISLNGLVESFGSWGEGEGGPDFIVAEDAAGMNTGVMLFRRSDWTLRFIDRVANSPWSIAWEQSMLLWETVAPCALGYGAREGGESGQGGGGIRLRDRERLKRGEFPFPVVRQDHQLDLSEEEATSLDEAVSRDCTVERKIRLVHQKVMNAYLPATAGDWLGYGWEMGDFILHFAGCPSSARPCLEQMVATVRASAEQVGIRLDDVLRPELAQAGLLAS